MSDIWNALAVIGLIVATMAIVHIVVVGVLIGLRIITVNQIVMNIIITGIVARILAPSVFIRWSFLF